MNDLPPPMRSVWQSLLWKEWHEHKWKLAALTAVCVMLLCLFGLDDHRSLLLGMFVVPLCYGFLAGMFLGMGTAGGESGRKTLPFLQSLPVPMWQPGAAKLFAAIFTAILPLLAFVSAFCVWSTFLWFDGVDLLAAIGPWESFNLPWGMSNLPWGMSNLLAAILVSSTLGVSSLLLWIAAMGSNRSDEIRSGAIGFLIICLVWFVLAWGHDFGVRKEIPLLANGTEVLFAAAPGGVAFVGSKVDHLDWWPYLLAAIVGHAGGVAWYLRRYGKVAPGYSRSDGKTLALAETRYQHFPPPMRSQLTAIAWKQARETGPLALLAIAGILLIVAAIYLYDGRQLGMRDLGEITGGMTLMVCFFVTLVTGIGVFLEDLKPRVDDFWRSRPVSPSLWFGVKFVVGAVILATTFGALMLLAMWMSNWSGLRSEPHPILSVGIFCLLLLLTYTLSMATYCILRQPLYAAALTIGLLVGWTYVLALSVNYFHVDLPWQAFLAILLLSQVAAMALAWQAVNRNWQIAAT